VVGDFSQIPVTVKQMKMGDNRMSSSKLVKPPPIRFNMLELLAKE